MPSPTVKRLLENITQSQSLNTWSLIMTLFGDAVVPRGGSIASSSLQQVISELNIDNGAVRTALSRLTSDGHLQRERSGRSSYYSLAPSQQASFANAERQIYAFKRAYTSNVQCKLVAIEPGTRLVNDSDAPVPLMLSTQLALYFHPSTEQQLSPPVMAPGRPCIVMGDCDIIPTWLLNDALPRSLTQRYETLISNFSVLDGSPNLTDIAAVACRCLLIHEWRRLRLKTPAIPYQLLEQGHILRLAHDQVAGWYSSILGITDDWWNTTAQNRHGKLGPPQHAFKTRFASDVWGQSQSATS